MKDLKEFKNVFLIDELKHQNIGGKEFRIEKEGVVGDILDENIHNWTIALRNFVNRRFHDIIDGNENRKVYYGHVLETNLGYYILEDEIKDERF